MRKILLFITTILMATPFLHAQVKIGNNPTSINSNSLLELESTNKALRLPRLALTGSALAAPLSAHVEGMTVYNTNTTGDVTPGIYYNDGAKWNRLVETVNNLFWSTTGNTGTNSFDNFIGNTDDVTLRFRVNNERAGRIDNSSPAEGQSVSLGYKAGPDFGSFDNTAIGHLALTNNDNFEGTHNTAIGAFALVSNTKSYYNTAVGALSQYFSNVTDPVNLGGNTSLGFSSLLNNTTGWKNTALGATALADNTIGTDNIGIGYNAGRTLASGSGNIFIGSETSPNISVSSSNQLNIGNWIYGYNGNIGVGKTNPGAKLHVIGNVTDLTPAIIENCKQYADNAAAAGAGVPVGGIYRTADGTLKIVY